MKYVYLKDLMLENYRNFSQFSVKVEKGVNIIIGPNGSGKTNILESISFLSPGKGLKSSDFYEIQRHEINGWRSNFKLQSKIGIAEISSCYGANDHSRKITYNGAKISGSELSNLLNVIWLTPQMEGLFLGSASNRRKFFDRIVFSFEPNHAKNIARYDYYMRERSKFLSSGNVDFSSIWLSKLELTMAEEAFKIVYARENVVNMMQKTIDELKTDFPKVELSITPLFDTKENSDHFKSSYAEMLQNNRKKDAYSGRTNFGLHKSDLEVFHKTKQQKAKFCSTGEQKALLISIILASVEAILHNTKTTPILLLDELFVHLDNERKKYLSSYIVQTKMQTFITTTDMISVKYLTSKAHIIEL